MFLRKSADTSLDADYNANQDYDDWVAAREQILERNRTTWEEREGLSLLGEVNAVALNHFEVNGSLMASVPSQAEFRTVSVTIFADGKEIYSKVFDKIESCRIPAETGYAWEIRLTGTVDVRTFAMATTMQELASPN